MPSFICIHGQFCPVCCGIWQGGSFTEPDGSISRVHSSRVGRWWDNATSIYSTGLPDLDHQIYDHQFYDQDFYDHQFYDNQIYGNQFRGQQINYTAQETNTMNIRNPLEFMEMGYGSGELQGQHRTSYPPALAGHEGNLSFAAAPTRGQVLGVTTDAGSNTEVHEALAQWNIAQAFSFFEPISLEHMGPLPHNLIDQLLSEFTETHVEPTAEPIPEADFTPRIAPSTITSPTMTQTDTDSHHVRRRLTPGEKLAQSMCRAIGACIHCRDSKRKVSLQLLF